MKAISLTQPYATLIALGAKLIETRSWPTAYRGPLAIHAAKSFPSWARGSCLDEPFYSSLAGLQADTLPLGCVIATCQLIDCIPTRHIIECEGRAIKLPRFHQERLRGGQEISFGDYTTGRYGFILSDIVPLPRPIPARGKLGLWEWNEFPEAK